MNLSTLLKIFTLRLCCLTLTLVCLSILLLFSRICDLTPSGKPRFSAVHSEPNFPHPESIVNPTETILCQATVPPYIELQGHRGEVTYAAFFPDDKTVITASRDGNVRIWNAESGKVLQEIAGNFSIMSPDGEKIITYNITNNKRTVRIWTWK